MPLITFNFSVDAAGNFTYGGYTPGGGVPLPNWPFSGADSLSFECPTGPFTIRLHRTDLAPGAGNLPDIFGGPVHAHNNNGVWVAPVPVIQDGLTNDDRKDIFHKHGFIAKYRYVIGVLNGGHIDVDDNYSGIHTC